ncbi:uncharacterized protein BXZ73DRAFT_77259 [Epithele typhae]|uniref:uncharacterized protein n=1 Tax=Epithele typhae TaxID=378194 RepID=UPI0020083FE9|nr:uncharacterized protein BXZ73DRAFT_77259 [Epithele typhae]KAH9933647.1 hypothetical protein BXZ73DRAFT_77259 [Epithele typhae]
MDKNRRVRDNEQLSYTGGTRRVDAIALAAVGECHQPHAQKSCTAARNAHCLCLPPWAVGAMRGTWASPFEVHRVGREAEAGDERLWPPQVVTRMRHNPPFLPSMQPKLQRACKNGSQSNPRPPWYLLQPLRTAPTQGGGHGSIALGEHVHAERMLTCTDGLDGCVDVLHVDDGQDWAGYLSKMASTIGQNDEEILDTYSFTSMSSLAALSTIVGVMKRSLTFLVPPHITELLVPSGRRLMRTACGFATIFAIDSDLKTRSCRTATSASWKMTEAAHHMKQFVEKEDHRGRGVAEQERDSAPRTADGPSLQPDVGSSIVADDRGHDEALLRGPRMPKESSM